MKWVNESEEQFGKMLRSALNLTFPYANRIQRELPDGGVKAVIPAAVLLLFAFSNLKKRHLLFTQRTESVETHKGQIAFPGGRCEDADRDGPLSTALRETEEEVGITSDKIQIIGKLPSLITTTRFSIQPVVGVLKNSLEETPLQPNPQEIAEVLWVPLLTLLNPGVYRRELFQLGSLQYPIDVYQVKQYRIWGATGSMTKNMLDRLSALEQH